MATIHFLAPHIPALMVLAFAVSLGSFNGAAGAWQAILGHAVLLATLAVGGRWVPSRELRALVFLWLVGGLSCWLSPVSRAGVTAIALLPGMLAVPWFVARCWRQLEQRRLGLRSLAWVVASISLGALLRQYIDQTPRAAMPLGHHNLLASWLVILGPLVVVSWRVIGRGWSALAGILAGAALIATGSLTGALGAVAAAALAVGVVLRRLPSRAGRLMAVGVVMALALAVIVGIAGSSRLRSVFAGEDISASARASYGLAAWQGFLERPWVGWGPGATHWTLAEHLVPEPGTLRPGQIVADAHQLPLQLLFEIGLLGVFACFLALVLVLTARGEARVPGLTTAAAASLLGAGVVSLGGMDLSVTALPMALAVAMGAWLASRGSVEPASSRRRAWVGCLLAVALGLWQMPRALAHLAYESALTAQDDDSSQRILQSAVRWDPSFPLYSWRLAQQLEDDELAWEAALTARSMAVFWLVAGDLKHAADDPAAAAEAWTRACDLDPLAAMAAFRLATKGPPRSVEQAARAVSAEPLLLASPSWDDGARWQAVELLHEHQGLDPGWRAALVETMDRIDRAQELGPERIIGLRVDVVAAESMSLFAFRRRPWPTVASRAVLSSGLLPLVDLPPATTLATTDGEIFRLGCGLATQQ